MKMLHDPNGKPSHTRYIVVALVITGIMKWVLPPFFGIETTLIDADIIKSIFYTATGTSVLKGGIEVFKNRRSGNTVINNSAP